MYPDAFAGARQPEYPDAGVLASMVATGRAVVLPPDPLYLRRPDAVEPSPRRPVVAGMNARRRPAESNVSLEPMRWWDVDGVMDLERDLFGDECWTIAMFWSELAEPETRHYLVARDGR